MRFRKPRTSAWRAGSMVAAMIQFVATVYILRYMGNGCENYCNTTYSGLAFVAFIEAIIILVFVFGLWKLSQLKL